MQLNIMEAFLCEVFYDGSAGNSKKVLDTLDFRPDLSQTSGLVTETECLLSQQEEQISS